MKKSIIILLQEGGPLKSTGPLIGPVSASKPIQLNEMSLDNGKKLSSENNLNKGFKAGNILSTISSFGSSIGSVIGGDKYKKTSLTQKGDTMFDSASDAVMMINPLAGGIMKAGGFLSDTVLTPLGGTKANATKMDQLASSKLLSLLPSAMINSFTAKKLDNQVKVNQNILASSSYGGTSKNMMDAASRSENYYGGLYSRKAKKRDEEKNAEALRQMKVTTKVLNKGEDSRNRQISGTDMFAQRSKIEQSGGLNNYLFGKDGMKFILDFRKSYDKLKNKKDNESNTQFLKSGGIIKDKNIIPEGKLHKELHHINNNDITRKGIPVIMKEGDKITQVAEIEKEEWIMRKELTNTIEDYYKKYNESDSEKEKDDILIEVGKLLVKELLYNTIDKSKLIKNIE